MDIPDGKLWKTADYSTYLIYLIILMGLFSAMCFWSISMDWAGFGRGHEDFLVLYTGASLVGTNQLYSFQGNEEFHKRTVGWHPIGIYYTRPPVYAALLRPFTWMPYRTAYLLFQILSLGAAIWSILLMTRNRLIVAVMLLFFPLMHALGRGQDVTLVLFFFTASLLLARRGRHWLAGLALSACLIKFHLFFLVPFALIRHKRWQMFGGAASGVALWIAGSTLVAGFGWPKEYYNIIRSSYMSLGMGTMPNIYSIFQNTGLEAYAAALTLALILYGIVKHPDFEISYGFAALGGILLTSHSYVYDCLLLLPILLFAFKHGRRPTTYVSLFLFSSIPYIFQLLRYGGILLAALVALIVLLVHDSRLPATKISPVST